MPKEFNKRIVASAGKLPGRAISRLPYVAVWHGKRRSRFPIGQSQGGRGGQAQRPLSDFMARRRTSHQDTLRPGTQAGLEPQERKADMDTLTDTTLTVITRSALETVVVDNNRGPELAKLARQWLDDRCPYAYYFRDVTLSFDNGVLILNGYVPTYFLKQVLQEILGKMPEIALIDNRVDVVSSDGLSSVRPR